jgi:hypothetical protein
MSGPPVKSFTVRFPEALHQAASDAAARSRMSLELLVLEATEAYLRQQEEQRLFDSYTRLGEDLARYEAEREGA